jgi:hypothetical protein
MYTCGYVENMIDNDFVPMMCLCIEDMLHVSCSDCSQNNAELTVTLDVDANSLAAAVATDDLHVEFNACRGFDSSDGTQGGAQKDNDLASCTSTSS